ncbi:MFS transporter [Corynebacterium amycolatum]|uniref:MFS transporter n=1 Tax=Corynebacterium amycolatum TaxID=43765 RepID=UPI000C7645B3|nr:MFS transporter [Corynebacterium amycolatum]PLA35101.1 MFS transporter [Corynebacterium amycolatum]
MTSSSEVTTHNDDHKPRARRAGAFSSHRRPVPVQDDISDLRRILVIVALSVGAFGIGVTEFVAMGLLPYIADAFGRDEDAAGRMISMYALGVVVGAPLITVLTGSIPRRRMLLLLMAAFTIGNGATVWAGTLGSFEAVMVSRFIAGLPHGAYFSVAALVAASLAKPGQRGKMVALSGVGLSVATVIGVPAAQVLGQMYGWRSAFAFVAVIGLIALVSLWFAVPHMNRMPKTRPMDELSALVTPQVLLTVAIGTVGFGGMFAVYTYITWTMTREAGMSENHIWIVLMAYGIGMVVGTYIGGWLSDRIGEWGIMVALVLMVIMLSAFYFTSQNAVLGTINFLLIGLLGSVLVPNLQTRLMDVAGRAQTLAAALNQAALNMANAFGAALGGWVISSGYGYRAPALGGATLAMLAIFIALPTIVLYRRSQAKKSERIELR